MIYHIFEKLKFVIYFIKKTFVYWRAQGFFSSLDVFLLNCLYLPLNNHETVHMTVFYFTHISPAPSVSVFLCQCVPNVVRKSVSVILFKKMLTLYAASMSHDFEGIISLSCLHNPHPIQCGSGPYSSLAIQWQCLRNIYDLLISPNLINLVLYFLEADKRPSRSISRVTVNL